MKHLSLLIFALILIVKLPAQEDYRVSALTQDEVDRDLFQVHLPLLLRHEDLREKVLTNGHEGGIAVYIDVSKYPEFSSRRAFFSNGVQTYALTEEQLEFRDIDTYMRLDSVKHHGEKTSYNLFTYTPYNKELGVDAIILNTSPKDEGPELGEISVVEVRDKKE